MLSVGAQQLSRERQASQSGDVGDCPCVSAACACSKQLTAFRLQLAEVQTRLVNIEKYFSRCQPVDSRSVEKEEEKEEEKEKEADRVQAALDSSRPSSFQGQELEVCCRTSGEASAAAECVVQTSGRQEFRNEWIVSLDGATDTDCESVVTLNNSGRLQLADRSLSTRSATATALVVHNSPVEAALSQSLESLDKESDNGQRVHQMSISITDSRNASEELHDEEPMIFYSPEPTNGNAWSEYEEAYDNRDKNDSFHGDDSDSSSLVVNRTNSTGRRGNNATSASASDRRSETDDTEVEDNLDSIERNAATPPRGGENLAPIQIGDAASGDAAKSGHVNCRLCRSVLRHAVCRTRQLRASGVAPNSQDVMINTSSLSKRNTVFVSGLALRAAKLHASEADQAAFVRLALRRLGCEVCVIVGRHFAGYICSHESSRLSVSIGERCVLVFSSDEMSTDLSSAAMSLAS